MFKNSEGSGQFTIAEPTVKLITKNSFGMPLDVKITKLQAENPDATPPTSTSIPNTLPFPLPIKSPTMGQIGQSITADTVLDKDNSNLVNIFSTVPKIIIYTVDAKSVSAATGQSSFVLDTSKISIDMEVEFPLYGTAKNYVVLDTISDLDLGEDLSERAESGMIRIYNSNGFPLDANFQLYFVDANFNKLDSLMSTTELLKAAAVDGSTGKVTTPNVFTKDVVINNSQLTNLGKAKHLLVQVTINTVNGGADNVRLYSDYELDLKMGLQLKMKAYDLDN